MKITSAFTQKHKFQTAAFLNGFSNRTLQKTLLPKSTPQKKSLSQKVNNK